MIRHAPTQLGEMGADVDDGGGLADAALLVGDGEDEGRHWLTIMRCGHRGGRGPGAPCRGLICFTVKIPVKRRCGGRSPQGGGRLPGMSAVSPTRP